MLLVKNPTESQLVTACLQLLQLRGVRAWRSNNTGVFDPVAKRFRSFRGLKGVSDILGIFTRPCGCGVMLAVEVKTKTGQLRAEQQLFLDLVSGAGGLSLVVRSVGDLDNALRLEGIGT